MAGSTKTASRREPVTTPEQKARSESRLRERFLRRFALDEDGSAINFSLFTFIMMLMIGGMAVDLMNFETRRARLRATISWTG